MSVLIYVFSKQMIIETLVFWIWNYHFLNGTCCSKKRDPYILKHFEKYNQPRIFSFPNNSNGIFIIQPELANKNWKKPRRKNFSSHKYDKSETEKAEASTKIVNKWKTIAFSKNNNDEDENKTQTPKREITIR